MDECAFRLVPSLRAKTLRLYGSVSKRVTHEPAEFEVRTTHVSCLAFRAQFPLGERVRQPMVRAGHERKHLVAVYPLSDRDLAPDGGRAVRRTRRLSLAAGRAAAADRLPDHPGRRELAGRQPGNHGL